MCPPCVSELKETPPELAIKSANPHQTLLLKDVFASKGVNTDAIEALSSHGVAAKLIDTYFMGNYGAYVYPRAWRNKRDAARNWGRMVMDASSYDFEGTYTGTPIENEMIIQGGYAREDVYTKASRDYRKNGANRKFESGLVEVDKADEKLGTSFTPIAIVGAGAAGVLTGRALRQAGFKNITLFDNTGKVGGIWNRSNVAKGTKNNPFLISYDSIKMRPPGNAVSENSMMNSSRIEGSGRDVSMFIDAVRSGHVYDKGFSEGARLRVVQGNVKSIEPGDLDQKLNIVSKGEEQQLNFPIVIYAPGVGEPLPVSDPSRMETTNSSHEAGIRWQQQLTQEELEELAGNKSVVLIGFGNSTAEMLFQFQNFEDKTGAKIDYKVLTHYPVSSLESPHRSVNGLEPVFRDITKPNLVKLAGDLKHIEALYWRAMHQGKIIGDVKRWSHESGECSIKQADGHEMKIGADQLYTLIGYRQRPKILKQMGIQVIDEDLGIGAFDYDGEVQKSIGESGRDRLHAGFFAIGPIMKTPYNPNAMVIPGIQYQLNDLLTTVSMRAAEYALRPDSSQIIKKARTDYRLHNLYRHFYTFKESFAAPMTGRGPRPAPDKY